MLQLGWTCAAGGVIGGGIAGSFLSTLVVRLGRGESIRRGRSCCDRCGDAIPAYRNIPILSFAIRHGRCHACGGAINPRHLLLELACALIGAVSILLHPNAAGCAGALFGWLLAALALIDWDRFWLPDLLVLPLGLLGLGAGLAGLPPGLPDRLIGALAGTASLALLRIGYRRLRGREGLGGGDAKLLGAIGAWLGWAALPWVVLVAALLGLALVGLSAVGGRPVRSTDRLPLGTLLALAAWPLWLAGASGWITLPG